MTAPPQPNPSDQFYLHRLIFINEHATLSAYLSSLSADEQQHALSSLCRGQTPLTLAISLRHSECIRVLIEHGASTLQKNSEGWTPFQESTSIGDRTVMELIWRKRREELGRWVEEKGKRVAEGLAADLKDFYLEMNWSFTSIIPFVGSLCPSDTYKIFKKGNSVRIDTTLVGFEGLSWVRGDISVVFEDGKRLVVIDHQRRLVEQIWPRDVTVGNKQVEEEISLALNTKMLTTPDVDFTSIGLSRAQSGFWTFKVDRNERIGPWETSVWQIDTLAYTTKTRTEHLQANPPPPVVIDKKSGDVIPNPALQDGEDQLSDEDERIKSYEPGLWTVQDDEWKAKRNFRRLTRYRGSLEVAENELTNVSYEEFFSGEGYCHVGRQVVEERDEKIYKATLWMYDDDKQKANAVTQQDVTLEDNAYPPDPNDASKGGETMVYDPSSFSSTILFPPTPPPSLQSPAFPLQMDTLLPLLDLLGVSSPVHVRSLREFFKIQLPPGFPVQIDIPVGMLPVTARISFRNLSTKVQFPDDLYKIPGKKEGYRVGEVIKGTEGV
ncbi:GPCR-chaperone-domain-containing protein [Gaertneriomyces semiglobifer]|nr:GPCR-chaperone-domain-containing protein [Gaertneriomyces semiglobifer]